MTPTRRNGENIVGYLVLGFFIVALVVALGFSGRARLVPVPIIVVSLVVVVLQRVLQNRGKGMETVRIFEDEEQLARDRLEGMGTGDEIEVSEEEGGTLAGGLLIVAVFVGLILVVGLLAAVFGFILGYYLLVTKESFPRSLGIATLATGVIYLVFVVLLGVRMPLGIIGAVLGA